MRSRLLWGNQAVDGIRYPSAAHPGHVSYVLFATQNNVFAVPEDSERRRSGDHDRWFKLIGTATHIVTSEQIVQWSGLSGHMQRLMP